MSRSAGGSGFNAGRNIPKTKPEDYSEDVHKAAEAILVKLFIKFLCYICNGVFTIIITVESST